MIWPHDDSARVKTQQNKSLIIRYDHRHAPTIETEEKHGSSIEALLGLLEVTGTQYSDNFQQLIQAGLESEAFAVDDAINLMERHKKNIAKIRVCSSKHK